MSNRISKRSAGLWIVAWAICFLASSAAVMRAQVTATISGKVEDPSGAAIPGAAVTLTSTETGAARTVKTDVAGSYRVLSLPVGQYEIRAEASGFKVAVRTGVSLVVG